MSPDFAAVLATYKTEDLEATRLGKATLRPPVPKTECEHPWHDFKRHGRCCWFCGTIVVDFGD